MKNIINNMKKLIIIAALTLLSVCAFAQISIGPRTETLEKMQMGYYSLKAQISDADTTYYLSLNSNNKFEGQIIVLLGYRDEAIKLLESLDEYDDAGSNAIINLNNPSNNTAILKRIMGVKTYYIFKEHSTGAIYCYLSKPYIKKYISAMKKYGKQ